MITTNDFRKGNLMQDQQARLCLVEEISDERFSAPAIHGALTSLPNEPIVLTKEWAKDFGFDVVDMGDHWEFNKGDFQLIQIKVPMTGKELTPVYVLHSKKSKHIKVPYVHKLQNLYYELENEELTYNNR